MKLLIFAFLMMSSMVVLADENQTYFSKLVLKDNTYYLEGEPYTGKVIRRDPQGFKLLSFDVKKGKIVGDITCHRLDGSVFWTAQTKNNKLHGTKTTIYTDGSIRQIDHYRNGKLDGLSTMYHFNGHPYRSLTYHNSVLDGEYKIYYKDGSLKERGFYKKGEHYGLRTEYDKNGKITREILFKDGSRKKVWVHKDGKRVLIFEASDDPFEDIDPSEYEDKTSPKRSNSPSDTENMDVDNFNDDGFRQDKSKRTTD